jgi:hypothetical protein
MKSMNIIWVHLDGIRPDKKIKDYKARPDYLDEFAKDGVEYINAYTCFPSTVMSISGAMFSYPPLYYTKCFEQIDINTQKFKPIFQILKDNGYDVHSVLAYRPARKVLKDVLFPIPTKYYGKLAKDYNYLWNSKELDSTILSFLEQRKLQEPFALYLQYPCVPIKGDDSVNDAKKMLDTLRERGYFKNTIIVIWADHGWPHPDIQQHRTRLQKTLDGHDLIVANENLKVPLIFIYPRCKKGLKISTPVSTLDISPTLLSLLGIKSQFGHPKFSKRLPLKDKADSRIFRVDTRNYFQKNRTTVLINQDYKYINYYNGDRKDKFYDLKKDPDGLKNVINDPCYQKAINGFRDELILQEARLFNFQVQYMANKLKQKFQGHHPKIVQVICSGNALFDKVVRYGAQTLFMDAKVILVSPDKASIAGLTFIPLANPFSPQRSPKRDYFYIDYNFKLSKKPRIYRYMLKKMIKDRKTFMTEPKVFLRWIIVLVLRAYEKLI